MEPKPRPLVVDAHILAYLGQFMNMFEKKMRIRIQKEIATLPPAQAPTSKSSSTNSQ